MDKAKQGSASAVATGLRGVIAAASSIGDVNGEKGELIYQGINIHDLATKSTFEFSDVIGSVSPPAGLAVFDSGAAFPTDAFGLLAAGLAHP